jgi:hypothetical protein
VKWLPGDAHKQLIQLLRSALSQLYGVIGQASPEEIRDGHSIPLSIVFFYFVPPDLE